MLIELADDELWEGYYKKGWCCAMICKRESLSRRKGSFELSMMAVLSGRETLHDSKAVIHHLPSYTS